MKECIAYLDGEENWHVVPHEELIRCKDCAFWDSEDGKKGYCNGFNLVYRQFESDYYCATAERKQE